MTTSDRFPTDTAGLSEAVASQSFELADGDRFVLRIAPVVKQLGEAQVRIAAYNGSIPGPTLRTAGIGAGRRCPRRRRSRRDGALARFAPRQPLRRHDGDAGADRGRRRASPIASSSRIRGLLVPPSHPGGPRNQELGLYGNVVVVPSDPDYFWPPVSRD